jgi:tetratricopeptide (TPR) repeat protein
MQFDPENHVVKLCAQGMQSEGEGKPEEASELFIQAWNAAANDREKFTAAHYVARQQKSVADKLKWDQAALNLALKIGDEDIKGAYPSLYLNIAKCYEDLNEFDKAHENYQSALKFTTSLLDDGYGSMIRSGINKGIERVQLKSN